MNAYEYYEFLRKQFDARRDINIAEGQIAYMKGQFDFFGIKAPMWQAMLKEIFSTNGILKEDELKDFVTYCFDDDNREMHYAAIEMVQKGIKKQSEEFISFIEYMIVTKSWWDTVDWISTKLVGEHFKRFPNLIESQTLQWMASQNIWLQRVCIIFQLRYKQNTDFDLLKKNILEVAGSTEFFLRKASGWALREYSRTNPNAVLDFVNSNPHLSKLTQKEAKRLIEKQ